jgi:hypothetical protein
MTFLFPNFQIFAEPPALPAEVTEPAGAMLNMLAG